MRVYLLMGLMDSYNVLIKMVDSGGLNYYCVGNGPYGL